MLTLGLFRPVRSSPGHYFFLILLGYRSAMQLATGRLADTRVPALVLKYSGVDFRPYPSTCTGF